MRKLTALHLCLAGCLVAVLAGCAPTKVTTISQHAGMLQQPTQIYVYNFAVSPDEVKLTRGLGADLEQLVKGTPRTEEELAVGHKAADALAKALVNQLSNIGIFFVDRGSGPFPSGSGALVVEGQFLSINQGNRTERVVVGLGLGRSEVKTLTQVYDASGGGRVLVSEFETDAKSGFKPGAAETMGVGAAAGTVGTAAAMTAGTTALSETLGTTVEADADRTAKDIVKKLKAYFVLQGWLLSSD